MKIQVELNQYLLQAQKIGIKPNFYLSEVYLKFAGAVCYSMNEWIWIEADDWCMFPPFYLGSCFTTSINDLRASCPVNKYWSDFEKSNYIFGQSLDFFPNFLDYEYIFNPKHFNDMKGGKWNIYRKNIRKWPKFNEKWVYGDYFNRQDTELLLADWLDKKSKTVQEAEMIIQYLLSDEPGIYRKSLYSDGKLMAVNAWDENWQYINYRFCIVDKSQPFLDEFTRYLFYIDPEIQSKDKLVNDGGSLNNKGLERFKDKLNPIQKRSVYSWIKNK